MKCSLCSHEDSKVLESRLSHAGRCVRRRRSCLSCGHRFTTYEKEEELAFLVKKKDGRFEPYIRDKALRSVQIACQKRRISIDEIEALLVRIEHKLQEQGERVIASEEIGDLIMAGLQQMDHVAYVRFASVYKDFKDPNEFMSALQYLKSATKDPLLNVVPADTSPSHNTEL